MKPSDFPQIKYKNRLLLLVPEVVPNECTGCVLEKSRVMTVLGGEEMYCNHQVELMKFGVTCSSRAIVEGLTGADVAEQCPEGMLVGKILIAKAAFSDYLVERVKRTMEQAG